MTRPMVIDDDIRALAAIAGSAHGLELLIVFGSRARNEARAGSDWDFAYIAAPHFDPDALMAALVQELGTDRVDVIDLAHAGGQLRFRAAADGRVVFEARPGTFSRFWMDAVSYWCDMQPIIGRGYAAVLERLDA